MTQGTGGSIFKQTVASKRNDIINEKCGLSNDGVYDTDVLQRCELPQFFFYLGYVAGLWSRLAEIGIRTTFIVFTSTTALLFETVNERIEKIAKKALIDKEYSRQEIAFEMDELRCQYDLVCQLVEQVNRSFGFVLLIITGHDFATSIIDFGNILDYLEVGKTWLKSFAGRIEEIDFYYDTTFDHDFRSFGWTDSFRDFIYGFHKYYLRSDPFKTFQFAHPVLRFLLLLVVSHRVRSKVQNLQRQQKYF